MSDVTKRNSDKKREGALHLLHPALISLMACWPGSRWDVSPGATGQEEADKAGQLLSFGVQTKHCTLVLTDCPDCSINSLHFRHDG